MRAAQVASLSTTGVSSHIRRWPFGPCWSYITDPSGTVAAIASKAAGVMAMRINA
jgi:hypothetical protein